MGTGSGQGCMTTWVKNGAGVTQCVYSRGHLNVYNVDDYSLVCCVVLIVNAECRMDIRRNVMYRPILYNIVIIAP